MGRRGWERRRGGHRLSPPPDPGRAARAQRLGDYFEVQLRFAGRLSEITGEPLGEMAFRHTNIHRRLGLGVPVMVPRGAAWDAYAGQLEALGDIGEQVALTQAVFLASPPEAAPLPGQAAFGCFAHEPANDLGDVRIHFYNRDADDGGGPLAAGKQGKRRAELADLVRHIREAHPEAKRLRGRSWLYNLDAYRRLFPPDYADSRAPASEPIHLSGTSSWGQLIDAREAVRPAVRDAFVANFARLDPSAPWRIFPHPVLEVSAPMETFYRHFGV